MRKIMRCTNCRKYFALDNPPEGRRLRCAFCGGRVVVAEKDGKILSDKEFLKKLN